MEPRQRFSPSELAAITHAAGLAEELVSNHYKMSTSQWLRPQYDVQTLAGLTPQEVIDGPFAQIIRYKGQPNQASLSSATYDFYKICLQDHAVLAAVEQHPDLDLLAFALYIITHELIHIVRFSRFLQGFEASPAERLEEEKRVHARTHEILSGVKVPGMQSVLLFYTDWRTAFEFEQIDQSP
jgi:hypothetical protein